MCYVEPLGIEYIASSLEAAGHDVRISFPLESMGDLREEIILYQPHIVCISVYTYARDEAMAWARSVKAISPKIIVIVGGYHPTALPEDMLGPYVDYAVIGEGEHTITCLLDTIEKGDDPCNMQGIAYLVGNRLCKTLPRQRINDIDSLPNPHRMKSILQVSKNYQIMIPPPSRQVALAQVFYSRGCPNNCEFCASSQIWGRKRIYRKPENVLDEIEDLQQQYGTNIVFFPDLELNGSSKKLHELCDEFIRRDLDICWWGLFSPRKLDNDILYHIKEAGCVKISIGIEGIGDSAFKNLKSGIDLTWDNIKERFNKAQDIGLITRALIMIGNEWDTPEYYDYICGELPTLALDDIRISFTTPFPGTSLSMKYNKAHNALSKNYSLYHTEHPILRNKYFSVSDLFEWKREIIRSFYLSENYKYRVISRVTRFPILQQPYIEYLSKLKEKGELSNNSIIDYLLHLLINKAQYETMSTNKASENSIQAQFERKEITCSISLP